MLFRNRLPLPTTRSGRLLTGGTAGLVIGAVVFALLLNSVGFPARPAREMPIPAAIGLLGMLLLMAGAGVATFIGLILYVGHAYGGHAAADPQTGRPPQLAPIRNGLAILAVSIVVQVLIVLARSLYRRSQTGTPIGASSLGALDIAISVTAFALTLIVIVWARMVRTGYLSWSDLGVDISALTQSVRSWLLLGIGAGLIMKISSILIGSALLPFGVTPTQAQFYSGVVGAPLEQFIVFLAVTCALAPFAEELFFRGYLFRLLLAQRGARFAYAFSALLFTAAHGNPSVAVEIFVIGLFAAWLVQRTGSIIPSTIAHGLNNLISFAALYVAPLPVP